LLIAFNKPYGVLSQFTPDGSGNLTLSEFGFPRDVYPLGRLDADSEGLLLLSDEPGLNSRLLDPERGHPRTYWVQVENIPDEKSLQKLQGGVIVRGHRTLPCRARILKPQPGVGERVPPIRSRKNIPVCWIELELSEGKNRQVRRMTAAVEHPTLRLIRVKIGSYKLKELSPGRWKILTASERKNIFE
jgi:23S rRNA pseudouridine2457 synthase